MVFVAEHPFPRRRDNAERVTTVSPRGEMSQLRSAFGTEGCPAVRPPGFNSALGPEGCSMVPFRHLVSNNPENPYPFLKSPYQYL
jgi:hypothetical protein